MHHLPMFTTFYCTPSNPLTEKRIEDEAERLMSAADKRFMSDPRISQEDYDKWCATLNHWVSKLYTHIGATTVV